MQSVLLTLDNGVVAAPVQEDTRRRLGTAVHLVTLNGHSVAPLRRDDAVVPVVVDHVVVDGQEVAVVVGVEAVAGVVVHLVVPPVALLVTVRVHPEVHVVDVRVVDVAVHVHVVEYLRVALVRAEPADLGQRVQKMAERGGYTDIQGRGGGGGGGGGVYTVCAWP